MIRGRLAHRIVWLACTSYGNYLDMYCKIFCDHPRTIYASLQVHTPTWGAMNVSKRQSYICGRWKCKCTPTATFCGLTIWSQQDILSKTRIHAYSCRMNGAERTSCKHGISLLLTHWCYGSFVFNHRMTQCARPWWVIHFVCLKQRQIIMDYLTNYAAYWLAC